MINNGVLTDKNAVSNNSGLDDTVLLYHDMIVDPDLLICELLRLLLMNGRFDDTALFDDTGTADVDLTQVASEDYF